MLRDNRQNYEPAHHDDDWGFRARRLQWSFCANSSKNVIATYMINSKYNTTHTTTMAGEQTSDALRSPDEQFSFIEAIKQGFLVSTLGAFL